jgi:integrin beta 1
LATDAGFHQALDGKLAGIIIPNDGKCHLGNGTYTHSTIQDYPSIPQINLKVKENSMNIIFAVTDGVMDIYQKLANLISGSYVAQLTDDSSNIVDLIKEQYKKISTIIQLKDNAGDGIRIKYESKCMKHSEAKIANQCENVPLGESVEFSVTVTVTSCPEDPKEWVQNLTVIFWNFEAIV